MLFDSAGSQLPFMYPVPLTSKVVKFMTTLSGCGGV